MYLATLATLAGQGGQGPKIKNLVINKTIGHKHKNSVRKHKKRFTNCKFQLEF